MKLETLRALQKTAEHVAKNAGVLLLKSSKTHFQMREKAPFDLVTSADLAANKLITEQLLKAWPESLVLAEEDDVTTTAMLKKARDRKVLWIVDPLDGTTNFSKHVPQFAVSIAAYNPHSKEILVGCVYDPSRKECFTAIKGGGAKRNGKKLEVSATDTLHFSLGATGFSYSQRRPPDNNLCELAPFVEKCLGVRRFGAASLDLAWIACGRLDLYWEPGLKPWDVAAGILLVREAGGLCSNFASSYSTPFDNNIVATNSHLHQIVLGEIKSARKKAGLRV